MLQDPFPDMSCALSQELNSDLVNAFVPTGMPVKLAIYHSRPGSQFCTPSEAAFLKQSGADLTGNAGKGYLEKEAVSGAPRYTKSFR